MADCIASLQQLDANENSADPQVLLDVLALKVVAKGVRGTTLEAAARDIQASAKRLREAVYLKHGGVRVRV
jgi:hypothetical protein